MKGIFRKRLRKKIDFANESSSKHKMRKKINTLTLQNDYLEDVIKSELFKTFMKKLDEPDEINRLKEENKKLRLKIKELRESAK